MSDHIRKGFAKPHLWLIKLIGVLVPRRVRADWRQEWEAELRRREALLARSRSGGQKARVEHLKPDVGMARAQGAMGPLALKLAEHVLPFSHGQASPFDLGHQQALGIFRVRAACS